MPDNRLSTYMLCNSGWSKPVWYFSATSKTWYSSVLNFSGSSDSLMPLFMFTSVNFLSENSLSVISPENATSDFTSV
ncbi:hypothetical protein D3C78_1890370 [compost metagenome]